MALLVSLSGTEWSSDFKVISDVTSLVPRVELEVVFLALFSMSLHIDVLVVIPVDGLSLILIECLGLSGNELIKSGLGLSSTRLVCLRVHHTEHMVVLSVDV